MNDATEPSAQKRATSPEAAASSPAAAGASVVLELPDGSRRTVPAGTTPQDVARAIGPGLAKAAVAAKLDGAWVDLRAPLARGGAFRLITTRDPEAGEVVRHSAEHVMADAVARLWPGTQIDVGRSDHSEKFQYDLDVPVRISPDDLPRIEAEMQRIVDSGLPFEREVMSREAARKLFESLGQRLKVSRIDDIPEGESITIYRHGDFVDLCRGPHVQNTRQIGAFKLTDLAGSYWRGDESNKMLQRVYGVAFTDAAALRAYSEKLEEARRRDHRRLGAELELFHFHEWAPGSPFLLPKGAHVYNALIAYMRELYERYGYTEVICPQIFSADLYRTSGHWDLFKDDMFVMTGDDPDDLHGVKPMNCPGHCLLFRSRKRSYRELPLRLAEFTRLHRNERSGTLHGMTRVRSFAQDDAHIFCEPSQVRDELDRHMAMTQEVYRDLGLAGVQIDLATRPAQCIGTPEDWDRAEAELRAAVERAGTPCGVNPGGGAFYAPKLEFNFRDVMDRVWTLATVQLDMGLPARFGLRYVGRDGEEHQPAMLHRAILGAVERFLGIYVEHTAGELPLWLAPQQIAVLPVTERHAEYASKVQAALRERGLRSEVSDPSERLGYRIRAAELAKIPCILVVGDRESQDGTVTLRQRHEATQRTLSLDTFRDAAAEAARTRRPLALE
jgi:threonyl-tRNA synthetase